MMPLLEVKNLHTNYLTRRGVVQAVYDVSFSLKRGRTLGIVGEAGSGKTTSVLSILQLLDRNGRIDSGEIWFDGEEITKMDQEQMRQIRGNDISFIFQGLPMSLNPVFTVEEQVCEPFLVHQNMSKAEAENKVTEMLSLVNIADPESVKKLYPHQLSEGMRQRIMIAMAFACEPKLLIADEPTSSLDVTIQAQILTLIKDLKSQANTSILLTTPDIGVIHEMADDVLVMNNGFAVEEAPVEIVFGDDGVFSHPYTEELLKLPGLDAPAGACFRMDYASSLHRNRLHAGCVFASRCQYATDRCREVEPEWTEVEKNHRVRCFYPRKGVRSNGR